MDTHLQKMFKSYVRDFYINSILNNKVENKINSSNIMFTSYFRKNMHHIKCANNQERKKFFFSFRSKHIEEFKRLRKYYTTVISNFRNRTAFKKFRSAYSEKEWDRINGEKLTKFLALHNESIKKVDFEFLHNIIKILDK